MNRWVVGWMDGWMDRWNLPNGKGRDIQAPYEQRQGKITAHGLWMDIDFMGCKTGKDKAQGVGWSQTANLLSDMLRSLYFFHPVGIWQSEEAISRTNSIIIFVFFFNYDNPSSSGGNSTKYVETIYRKASCKAALIMWNWHSSWRNRGEQKHRMHILWAQYWR